MKRVSIVVLSRYADLFHGFRKNVETHAPNTWKVLIRDGSEIVVPDGTYRWRVYAGKEPFTYSRNVNHGWQVTLKDDVILCGDDIRFESSFVEELREVAYSDENVGVATVQLWGQSPFVCGYFKRSVIDKVGQMDERFVGYGKDDNDWCKRMEALGYRTQPTETVKAKHSGGTSFLRRGKETGQSMEELCDINNKLFEDKWRESW